MTDDRILEIESLCGGTEGAGDCPRCMGSGSVFTGPEEALCAACNGTGIDAHYSAMQAAAREALTALREAKAREEALRGLLRDARNALGGATHMRGECPCRYDRAWRILETSLEVK